MQCTKHKKYDRKFLFYARWVKRSTHIMDTKINICISKKEKKKRSTYSMDTIYVASIVLMPWTRAKPTKKKVTEIAVVYSQIKRKKNLLSSPNSSLVMCQQARNRARTSKRPPQKIKKCRWFLNSLVVLQFQKSTYHII